MNEPLRKRIVINLETPGHPLRGQSTAKRARRWPKVLAVLFVLVLVAIAGVTIGGYFWWRHYQATPAYSLALMIDAAQRDDLPELEKRLDDEQIVSNMVTAVSQKAQARYGLQLTGPFRTQIDKMVPTLLPRLRQTIHEEIAKTIKEFSAQAQPKPFVIVALAVPSLVTFTGEGDIARAGTVFNGRTVQLTMRRDGDRWKVTEFKDDRLVQRAVDSIMKDLPAIGAVPDLPIDLFKRPRRSRQR
jgi:hypothetical protein